MWLLKAYALLKPQISTPTHKLLTWIAADVDRNIRFIIQGIDYGHLGVMIEKGFDGNITLEIGKCFN